jgi:hypothetical protein
MESKMKAHQSVEDQNVNHPKHYATGKIEVIEFIEDKRLGFNLGNAVKYVSRAGVKDASKYTEDLKKAIWYIQREIDLQAKSEQETHDDINESLKEQFVKAVKKHFADIGRDVKIESFEDAYHLNKEVNDLLEEEEKEETDDEYNKRVNREYEEAILGKENLSNLIKELKDLNNFIESFNN